MFVSDAILGAHIERMSRRSDHQSGESKNEIMNSQPLDLRLPAKLRCLDLQRPVGSYLLPTSPEREISVPF